jgi:hypothetical protein
MENGQVPTAASKLIARWTSVGLPLRPGCPPGRIDSFEARIGVRLPSDLRDFLARANGSEKDETGFSFWPLEEYESFDQEVAHHSQNWPRGKDSGSYYVFCDYLHWSWGYAIRLADRDGESAPNTVIPIGMKEIFTVADTFSEFVDLYLADSPKLYPP